MIYSNAEPTVFQQICVFNALGGHTVAEPRHRNTARPQRGRVVRNLVPVLGLLSLMATGVTVVIHENASKAPAATVPHRDLIAASLQGASTETSRSAERPPLPNDAAAADQITGHRFATSTLPVHAAAKAASPVLATLRRGASVAITGKTHGGWAQIMHNGLPRWVRAKELVKTMKTVKKRVKVMPLGMSSCASGSAMEAGLQPDTVKVHRAVCALFPQVGRYLGTSGGGEHATGRAIDIMVNGDAALGYRIAAFAQKNWRALGVSQVIWHQHIWTVQRSGDGWRPMPDRGSPTANHMDHVHVTTYGDAATG